MKRNSWYKRVALGTGLIMLISTTPAYALTSHSEIIVKSSDSEGGSEEKDYLVMAKSEIQVNELEDKFDCAEVVSKNAQNYLQENYMTSLTLSQKEKQELLNKANVQFVEEDVEVTASAGNVNRMADRHKMKVIKTVQKESDEEWNIRMIHADKARKIIKKNRSKEKDNVKIAILDSGVDYNTDMNIAETISLVPGKEEINPLFMDASGHGTCVAGLVAAKDNKDGITGVDPYAEIYSIRVLDDDNCSPISRVIEGIYMAIERKVDIINMSFGVNSYSKALEMAVRDALDAGILVIAAAGNSGSAEKAGMDSTVQYPAAFDGVLAVGSVDKSGEVADSSATGSEIDLVAPGELVRSTGMFGSEIVTSGTSLAAPQVTGAAALIFEKDKNVSAEFVSGLLCESANNYGESEEYGSGLLDVNYALENYESFRRNYKKKRNSIKSNENRVMIFKNTGCVEGCWSVGNHENLVNSYNNVKKGARFNDTAKNYEKYYVEKRKDGVKGEIYIITGMDYNPWWHGYFRKNYSGQEFCNYVAAYIYETRVANSIVSGVAVKSPGDLSNSAINRIKKDVNSIPWTKNDKNGKKLYTSNPSTGTKRAFVWGMAIHTLADSFAHSSATFSGNRVTHNSSNKSIDADNTSYLSLRWSSAQKAVNLAIKKYTASSRPSGTSNEFSPVKEQGQFKMINIEKYITSVDGAKNGATYAPFSIYKKYDNNK